MRPRNEFRGMSRSHCLAMCATGEKMTQQNILRLSDAVRSSFEPVMQALGPARIELTRSEEVAAVRPGYLLPREGVPEPAVVVAVVPGTPRDAIDVTALARQYGVPFSAVDATPEEQLSALGQSDGIVTLRETDQIRGGGSSSPWLSAAARGRAGAGCSRRGRAGHPQGHDRRNRVGPPVWCALQRGGRYPRGTDLCAGAK